MSRKLWAVMRAQNAGWGTHLYCLLEQAYAVGTIGTPNQEACMLAQRRCPCMQCPACPACMLWQGPSRGPSLLWNEGSHSLTFWSTMHRM